MGPSPDALRTDRFPGLPGRYGVDVTSVSSGPLLAHQTFEIEVVQLEYCRRGTVGIPHVTDEYAVYARSLEEQTERGSDVPLTCRDD